jgi:nitroreductase/NAD-dependent dihydropyrimidine dehydrogenase PreA subunit
MKILGVDESKCNRCRECVLECPCHLFTQQEPDYEVRYEERARTCIECGHCIAVCPTDAILFEDEALEQVLEFDPQLSKSSDIINPELLITLLRMRRSIRRFIDEPISEDDVQYVLDAMRYAPTAKNFQTLRYTVLSDRAVIRTLAEKVLSFLRMTLKISDTPGIGWLFRAFIKDARLLKNQIVKDDLKRLFEGQMQGVDELFYNAPIVIIAHTKNQLGLGYNETDLAFAYGMLAAEVLGLGTCWIGYAQKALKNSGGARRVAGITPGHSITGVMVLGRPEVTYYRAPPR